MTRRKRGRRDGMRDFGGGGEAGAKSTTGSKEFYEQSWAVVIGINAYTDPTHNQLERAVADALAVAESIVTDLRFPAGNVFLVLDTPPADEPPWLAATKAQLAGYYTSATKALLEELLLTRLPAKAGPDDRVLVYFAGHGAPRRAPTGRTRDFTPYLVPADARFEQWHTYIDLNNVTQQREYFRAKHVFYLLDACGCGLTGMRSIGGARRYEEDLVRRRARQCLTAGTAEQLVPDGGIGGHSVFTWHVLQEFRDASQKLLTASMLVSNIKRKVGVHKASLNSPDGFGLLGHEGGEFVFSAREASFTLEEHDELAHLLVDEVGPRLDEIGPATLAGQLWQRVLEAHPASEQQRRRARRNLGRARLLEGQSAEASERLGHPHLKADPEALLLRSVAQLKGGQMEVVQETLRAFLAAAPDHPYAGWATITEHALRHHPRKRYAVLVGAGTYRRKGRFALPGCEHDVTALADLLTTQFGFEVVTLVNEGATLAAIEHTIAQYRDRLQPEDSFIWYLSGSGLVVDDQVVFAPHDFDQASGTYLTERTIDTCMRDIRAHDKLLITDACHLAPMAGVTLGYRWLFGGRRDQSTFERPAADGTPRGAFTYALETELRTRGNALTIDVLATVAAELARRKLDQNPGYVGDATATFVSEAHPAFEILDLAARRSAGSYSAQQIDDLVSWLRRTELVAPPIWSGIGQVLLERRRHREALAALDRGEPDRTWLPRIAAHVALDEYGEARKVADSEPALRAAAADPQSAETLRKLRDTLQPSAGVCLHGLIVAIRDETSAHWTSNLDAEVATATRALVACGITEDHLRVVRDADKHTILAELERLVRDAGDAPACFIYIGPGSHDSELWISSADRRGRARSDVPFSELRRLCTGPEGLTSIVLFTRTKAPPTAPTTSGEPDALALGLGAATLVMAPVVTRDFSAMGASPPNVPHLLDVLAREAHRGMSLATWIERAELGAQVSIRGDATTTLFSFRRVRRAAMGLVQRIADAPLRRAVTLLTKLAMVTELGPKAWLYAGRVNAELGRHDDALDDVDKAIARLRTQRADQGVDAEQGVLAWPEMHYVRGCILLAARRYSEAEAALSVAMHQQGDDARTHYYRAHAIRRLIDADLENQARVSAMRYVALGAPLGLDDEVRRLVGAHESSL